MGPVYLSDYIEAVIGEPLPDSVLERAALYGLGFCGHCESKETLITGDYMCVYCRYRELGR